MRLNHNMMSLGIYNNYSKKIKLQSNALSKLTTGQKLVSSKDNPNAIGQSEMLRIQIRGLDMARKNLQDSAGMIQTVDGGLASINAVLHRIKELTIQAGGINEEVDKIVIQQEIEAMKQHIDYTARGTEFNGVKLLYNDKVIDNSNPTYVNTVSGANVGEKIEIPMYNLTIENLKDSTGTYSLKELDVTKPGGVETALNIIKDVTDSVISIRGKYGALQNKLESLNDAMGETSFSISRAESSIRDTDMAEEMMNYASNGILIESALAMIAQSNRFPQDILRVLERMK
ncbi:flagellin [Clostridium polynesiense]|uniref:flagellin N-terminal helical domain-containing protein n=1 Tax=Clostridium polynesiense TaxID=1325933 RepID=UPI0005914A98|nr:flagellin [Clostridium polynesiense]